MRLSEVVEEYPSLIPVLNRFNIRLGLGDRTVRQISEEKQLDIDFFLTMINTFLNEDYFPEKKLQCFHTSQIIEYLRKTNDAYTRHQLPNIERHLRVFISQNESPNATLELTGKFFNSFKEELLKRIENDNEAWFPYCLKLSEKLQVSNVSLAIEERDDSSIDSEDSVEAFLNDLKRILIKHLSGSYDENLCYAVIFAITTLGKDIKQDNRIRYRILAPMVASMEKL